MKKYNLSNIMKRAWELVKRAGMTISAGLKKAWKEAKEMIKETMKFNVIGNETFTVNTVTGEITGKTYNAKEWIKRNFNAKWDRDGKKWVADVSELKEELTKNSGYYEKYIVSEENSSTVVSEKDEIIRQDLVNKADGFYSRNTHASGRITYTFVG